MDKDENLFDDLIDEDDDLLNISLDELSGDETDGTVNEEPDEDIIDLIDLLEKGDDEDLLGIDDSSSDLTEDLTSLSNEDANDTMDLSSSDLQVDDLLPHSDVSEPEESPEPASVDELDQLFSDDALGDLSLETEEAEGSDDVLDDLFGGSELEDLPDGTEELDLEMEDIPDEDAETSQIAASHNDTRETTIVEGQNDLTDDFGLGDISDDSILGSDDDILDELDNELDKAILSDDDESDDPALWEDLKSETGESEDLNGATDVSLDELDDLSLDDEAFGDLLSESVEEEAVDNDSDIERTLELDIDDGQAETLDEGLTASEEAPLMEESLEDLFSESDLQEDTDSFEISSEEIQEPVVDVDQVEAADEGSGVSIDDAIESIEAEEDLFSDEIEESTSDEESAVSDDLPEDIKEEVSEVEEEILTATDEDIEAEADVQAAPALPDTLPPDESRAAEGSPSDVPQVPVISEEKVEAIVRDVVGEVVERIAREVFTEVAEKVITEAIDSLKKSLESDSE